MNTERTNDRIERLIALLGSRLPDKIAWGKGEIRSGLGITERQVTAFLIEAVSIKKVEKEEIGKNMSIFRLPLKDVITLVQNKNRLRQ